MTAEKDVTATTPEFGFPIGPWFEWFAWHPVKTTDRGWRWLRPVWRRRWQTKRHLSGPTFQWFTEQVARPRIPAAKAGDA